MADAATVSAEQLGIVAAVSPPKAASVKAEQLGVTAVTSPPHAANVKAEQLGITMVIAWHVPVPKPFVLKLPCSNWCLPLYYYQEDDKWTL